MSPNQYLGHRTFTVQDAARWCLYPLVPHALKSQVKRYTQSGVPRWITPASPAPSGCKTLARRPPPFPPWRKKQSTALLRGSDALSNEMQDRFDAPVNEGAVSVYDRRLIEFALALPGTALAG